MKRWIAAIAAAAVAAGLGWWAWWPAAPQCQTVVTIADGKICTWRVCQGAVVAIRLGCDPVTELAP